MKYHITVQNEDPGQEYIEDVLATINSSSLSRHYKAAVDELERRHFRNKVIEIKSVEITDGDKSKPQFRFSFILPDMIEFDIEAESETEVLDKIILRYEDGYPYSLNFIEIKKVEE